MNKNKIIILLVIVVGVLVGLQFNKQNKSVYTDNIMIEKNTTKVEKTDTNSGLSPDYLIDYFSKNGFTISPVDKGKMSDIYTAKMNVGNTNIFVYVDIYHERKSDQIKLIETTIDGSYYISYSNQKEIEELVTKVAKGYLVAIASIPYETSKPEEAKKWVEKHIPNSYDDKPKEKTSTKIGIGTLNIYGTPLMRTFEMDFGYGNIDIEDIK